MQLSTYQIIEETLRTSRVILNPIEVLIVMNSMGIHTVSLQIVEGVCVYIDLPDVSIRCGSSLILRGGVSCRLLARWTRGSLTASCAGSRWVAGYTIALRQWLIIG